MKNGRRTKQFLTSRSSTLIEYNGLCERVLSNAKNPDELSKKAWPTKYMDLITIKQESLWYPGNGSGPAMRMADIGRNLTRERRQRKHTTRAAGRVDEIRYRVSGEPRAARNQLRLGVRHSGGRNRTKTTTVATRHACLARDRVTPQ
ncbi:hypothetical protein J6590_037325 [Homalodisca vitripennis]|nr:hypothetical protein J6590_037325 [Homalodisca vitripennis]